jgi:5-methylthioribose kinase
MHEVNADNVVDYLKNCRRLDAATAATAELLAWGVSNVVLRIRPQVGDDFIVKQSREKLRTDADWFSSMERVWREAELMGVLEPLLPAGAIPRVLFEDRENYLFGMEAAPAEHTVWKEDLLDGRVEHEIASVCGNYLFLIHGRTSGNAQLAEQFGDRTNFDELRLDPFYRYLAKRHPALRERLLEAVSELSTASQCLVHADFSPKNILISPRRITLVDFETGHFGDPAFDLGFFLSHLLLKCVRFSDRLNDYLELARVFWKRYVDEWKRSELISHCELLDLERRAVLHLAYCMLSRVDGKSPVDYLSEPREQDLVRSFCTNLIERPSETLDGVWETLERRLQQGLN